MTDVSPPRDAGLFQRLAIPTLSARTMGVFRVLFGLGLFYVVLADPPRAQPLELHRNYSWLADWPLVHAVAASATACRVLYITTLGLAALFTVGLWTRPAYVALVFGILASRLVQLHYSGTHDWDLPLLTFFTLTIVPWGDGFSLDARRARTVGGAVRAGPLYGLAIWIPGFMLGLALAAAAYAKLTNGGLAWITSGAVKYHFIEDAANAPFTWGLWVAAHPAAAVLLSLGAVVVEAAFIGVIFVRSVWLRLLIGVTGLSLFAGFYLFQGVIWRPWLLLYTAFLPWALLDRGASGAVAGAVPGGVSTAPLRPWHRKVLAALAVQQVLVSLAGVQVEPLISNFPMYSSTFESTDAFERTRYRKMQRLLFESGGADVSERVHAISNAPENLLNAAEDVASDDDERDEVMTSLRGVRSEYQARYGADLALVTVIAERVTFNWQQGAFNPPVRVRIAEVQLPDAGASPR